MKNFKTFLKENIPTKNKLKDIITKFNNESNLDATGYYLKAGSSLFAMAIYIITSENGELYTLNDSENNMIHTVVKYDGYYWDINGGSGLTQKHEYISTVGDTDWTQVSKEQVLDDIESTNEIYDLVKKLKILDF